MTDLIIAPDASPVPSPPQTRARRRRASLLAIWLPPTLVLLGVIGAWYFISYVLLTPDRRFLLPPPHEVIQVSFLNEPNAAELFRGLGLSAEVAGLGLMIAIAIGTIVAVLMSQARWLERSIYPYAVVLQTIPILALVPMFGFWWGYGFNCRVIVVVMFTLFPIIANTLFGLRSVDRDHHDLFTLHRANRLTRLWKLELPAALPAIFAGYRISAGLAVIGAVVSDFFFKQGDPGIGALIQVYPTDLQSQQMFGAVILVSLLGITVFQLFGFLGRRIVGSWHESEQDRSRT